jgi:hypothetical protein
MGQPAAVRSRSHRAPYYHPDFNSNAASEDLFSYSETREAVSVAYTMADPASTPFLCRRYIATPPHFLAFSRLFFACFLKDKLPAAVMPLNR